MTEIYYPLTMTITWVELCSPQNPSSESSFNVKVTNNFFFKIFWYPRHFLTSVQLMTKSTAQDNRYCNINFQKFTLIDGCFFFFIYFWFYLASRCLILAHLVSKVSFNLLPICSCCVRKAVILVGTDIMGQQVFGV